MGGLRFARPFGMFRARAKILAMSQPRLFDGFSKCPRHVLNLRVAPWPTKARVPFVNVRALIQNGNYNNCKMVLLDKWAKGGLGDIGRSSREPTNSS